VQRIYRVGGYATFAILLLTLSFLMPNFTQTSAEEPRALDQNSMRSVLQNSEILDLDSGLDLIMNDPDQFHWLLFASISGREENGSSEVLWETSLGSPVSGFPVSFAVNGKQYVAVTTGPSLVAMSTRRLTPELPADSGEPRIYVFARP